MRTTRLKIRAKKIYTLIVDLCLNIERGSSTIVQGKALPCVYNFTQSAKLYIEAGHPKG